MTDMFDPIMPLTDLPRQSEAQSHYYEFHNEDEKHRIAFDARFTEQVQLFEKMMAFNFESLVVIYKNVDVWAEDRQRRFVHASLSSSFNHLMFARKAISLGYPFENQLVLRSALEWFERATLFHEDVTAVQEFITDGDIQDRHVRDRIEEIFDVKQLNTGSDAAKILRKLYRRFSTFGHATLQSLATRTFPSTPKAKTKRQRVNISKTLGLGISFGGSVSKDTAYLALIDMISLAEMLMQLLVSQIPSDDDSFIRRHTYLRQESIRGKSVV